MSLDLRTRRIQEYHQDDGSVFLPKPPDEQPEQRGQWHLCSIRPLEPGWVACEWVFREDYTVSQELRDANALLGLCLSALRRDHPGECDHPKCYFIPGIVARSLVRLGFINECNLPQSLEQYCTDLDIRICAGGPWSVRLPK